MRRYKLRFLLPFLKELIWADQEIKNSLQREGIHIIPANYYSSIPTINEIINSFEYSTNSPYLLETVFNHATIKRTLEILLQYSGEFIPSIDGDEERCSSFYWRNPMFSYCDAMSYYSLIRHLKPQNIIEIGSGFSTLIAIEATNKNGFGTIACIEPYPRNFIISLDNKKEIVLFKKTVQEIDSSFFNRILSDGDVLFIDSTHTVKSGSDCLHIYLRILPNIKKDIYVHVHDVFLPNGMPKEWLLEHQLFWTEQYLLLAFLIDNPKTSVIYGSAYSKEYNKEILTKMMDGKYSLGGGSLWFNYRGGKNV